VSDLALIQIPALVIIHVFELTVARHFPSHLTQIRCVKIQLQQCLIPAWDADFAAKLLMLLCSAHRFIARKLLATHLYGIRQSRFCEMQ
jgi:hypothetical protein